jgi:uncharacterized protein YggE
MMKTKNAIMTAGVALLLLLGLACNDSGIGASIGASNSGASATPAPESPTPESSSPAPVVVNSFPSGISVSGQGSVTVEPDLAVLNIGVEARGDTVSEARDEAATAMAAIIAAVKLHELSDADIQATSFNVRPRYDYREGAETLLGYQVNHRTTMKLRDLDSVGEIIDDVADAGGNATRINGISFTVEDRTPFQEQLREAAVQDAMTKAQHYAELTGVELGALVYLAEAGAGSPTFAFREQLAFGMEAAAASTSVSGGELTLFLTIEAVFGIE